jgi:glutathione S-transferase
MAQGKHREPDFLALNPFGKVPTIVDGNLTLFESGAILLYLADKTGQLPPDAGSRAIYTQWIVFASSTLAAGLFDDNLREREAPNLMVPLDRILAEHPFLLGKEFTVVDVALGSVLSYATLMNKIDYTPYPQVKNYVRRLRERPAFLRSMGSPKEAGG